MSAVRTAIWPHSSFSRVTGFRLALSRRGRADPPAVGSPPAAGSSPTSDVRTESLATRFRATRAFPGAHSAVASRRQRERCGMRIIDESEGGFSWTSAGHSWLERTSHALRANGDVWIVDPVDFPALDERVRALGSPRAVLKLFVQHGRDGSTVASRLGVPLLELPGSLPGSPFELVPVRAPRDGRRPPSGGRSERRSSSRRRSGAPATTARQGGRSASTRFCASCGHRRCSGGSSRGTCWSGTAPGCTRRCPSSCAPRSSGRAVTSCASCRTSSPLDSIPPVSSDGATA